MFFGEHHGFRAGGANLGISHGVILSRLECFSPRNFVRPALVTSPSHVILVVIDIKNQTPCRSDYVETSGIIFFARMLDKIRLHTQGVLPAGYNLGLSDPTSFDARFCRFWAVDYDRLAAKTLEGGTNEELLRWCFEGRNFPNEEQILVWNSFIIKRGWRDNGAPGLIVEKELNGFADRDDPNLRRLA